MVDPLISVVTPTYNRASYLNNTLQSVLNQDFQDIELILVDDGSTDHTSSIAHHVTDSRFRYIQKTHSGAPATRNTGVENACGKYLLWLDSDDELIEGTLRHYASEIENHPDIDILYGDLQLRDDTGNNSILAFENYYQVDHLLSKLIRGTIIPNPGTLVSKSLYVEHGAYDVRFRRAHDFEFWSRALANATIKHCGVTCCRYRWHQGNMSSGKSDMSFEAGVIKQLCHREALHTLFPDHDWSNPLTPLRVWERVANLLLSCNDHENAIVALLNGLHTLPENLSTLARNAHTRKLHHAIEELRSMPEPPPGELTIALNPLGSGDRGKSRKTVQTNTN